MCLLKRVKIERRKLLHPGVVLEMEIVSHRGLPRRVTFEEETNNKEQKMISISLELLKRRTLQLLHRREASRKNKQEVTKTQEPIGKNKTTRHCVLETAEENQARIEKTMANQVCCRNCNWSIWAHGLNCLLHKDDGEIIRHALAGECEHFATRETVKEYHDSGRDWLDNTIIA